MNLESLSNDLFTQIELTEAASVLGGLSAPMDSAAGTYSVTYVFLSDGSYVRELDPDAE